MRFKDSSYKRSIISFTGDKRCLVTSVNLDSRNAFSFLSSRSFLISLLSDDPTLDNGVN